MWPKRHSTNQQRKKEAAESSAARAKTPATNKAAFRLSETDIVVERTAIETAPTLNGTVALVEAMSDGSRLVSCLLCHTTQPSLTCDALDAGADWRCSRCGQHWDARRLAAVAAYAAWLVARAETPPVRQADHSRSRAST